jgi:hypothetical protein
MDEEPLMGLLLTKAQYVSMSIETHREPLFPSWPEWNKFQMRAAGAALKKGKMPQPWTIDVNAFFAWCASVSAPPSVDELRTYCLGLGAKRSLN